MKKAIVTAILILASLATQAQEKVTFEGKLTYRSFENTDKTIIKWSSGMAYNGARDITFLIKGNKVLYKDECTHMCTLLDPDNNTIILYSDLIGKGMQFDYTDYTSAYLASFSKNGPSVQGITTKPTLYRFETAGSSEDYQGMGTEYVKGRIENDFAGTSIDIYRVASYIIPKAMYAAQMFGIEMEGLITKFIWEQLNGGAGFVGKMKSYVCSELVDMEERAVDDAEFNIPGNIKIDKSESPFKVVGLYKANEKYLTKHKMYPTQTSEDVTYKIDEEWDF